MNRVLLPYKRFMNLQNVGSYKSENDGLKSRYMFKAAPIEIKKLKEYMVKYAEVFASVVYVGRDRSSEFLKSIDMVENVEANKRQILDITKTYIQSLLSSNDSYLPRLPVSSSGQLIRNIHSKLYTPIRE